MTVPGLADAALRARVRTEPFVFVIPVYNACSYIGRCLMSVLSQRGTWGAVVVDDCSSDGTWDVVQHIVGGNERFTVLRNPERLYAMANIDRAVSLFCGSPTSVIGVLDGDDWLARDDVVERMLQTHHRVDVVWSNLVTYPDGDRLGFSDYIAVDADVRTAPWVTWQFRTFKKWLFDRIDRRHFKEADGSYFRFSYDFAIMLPLLEMAGPGRRQYLDEVLYVYNRETPLNEAKIDRAAQLAATDRIRAFPSYSSVHPLTPPEQLALTRTEWRLFGSAAGEREVYEPEIVGFRFASDDPTEGGVVGLQRVISAQRGRRYRVGLQVRESYAAAQYPGRLEQQLLVDGSVVWRHDLSGDSFVGWSEVSVEVQAAADTLDVRICVEAVGPVERGWGWGAVSRSLVRGFSVALLPEGMDVACLIQAPVSAAMASHLGVQPNPRTAGVPRSEHLIFVVPVYNAEAYVERCLESIRQQRGPWGAVIIDDASEDATWASVLRLAGGDSRCTVLRNSTRRHALYNTEHAIRAHCSAPNSIIAVLDGDDWLLGHDVVEKMIAAHRRYDVVWSNHRIHPTGALGWSYYLPPTADVRRHKYVTSHLRTFKKHLFDRIDPGDFLDAEGAYFRAGGDLAYMFAVVELAGPLRRRFLDEALCWYNRETLLSDDKVAGEWQRRAVELIRSRPAYACSSEIDPDELSRISRSAWTLGGNCDGALEAYDAEVVGFRFVASPQAGERVVVHRTVEAVPGARYAIGLEVRDGYSDAGYPARIEQQISVGGLVLWRHDLSGNAFDGWNRVRLEQEASSTQVDIAVALSAVGAVEAGWGWEYASETVVRGFSWERLD